ncbi:hypothetical protein TTHERM_00158140 (macronuclear) [Tetrahymena thermophila SB210]|uniref:Uncharacterized protein n=1 Tax=Tetrahymena thermophila (strain SB210) TaxID=312017 RepID=Q22WC0_TETTS|nr:hypothetical protein TTHERM_00158140 [Tetrahymena thermophila SB210]EAR89497.2 hypothetical protein TTHERM_00158140 [Tetrahymena thermophila SB210]|eukprot:XP_001009742.2 hypothetical protein TTHERM_00158140 [Tetrahymena thermophila SB210]
MLKIEEEQLNLLLQSQDHIMNKIDQNQDEKYLERHTKQCFYRFQQFPNQVTVVCSQSEITQKQCQIRLINNNVRQNQSQQFSQYSKTFYYDLFFKIISRYNNSQIQLDRNCITRMKSVFSNIKEEESNHLASPQTMMIRTNHQLINQGLLNQVTTYLQKIKPRFFKVFSYQIDEIVTLDVKDCCQDILKNYVCCLFQKFLSKEKNKESKQKIQIISQQYFNNKKQGKKILKNKYAVDLHNFKNSFMRLVTQLICPNILDCFNLSEYQKNSLIEIIKRLKENSVKFRAQQIKYQHYTKIHYTALFLKHYETDFYKLNRNSKISAFECKIYQLDVSEFKNLTYSEILRCNNFKSLFGQIIIQCLQIAESQQQVKIKCKSNACDHDLQNNRYFYINKVKKGIQKLMIGKKAKGF